jgi:tRNA-dihydrouridine synthase B
VQVKAVAEANGLFKGKIILAPLAGITNLPFRMIAREFGCDLCVTEMVSANGLVRGSQSTIGYLKTVPGDSPLGVQIFGSDPSVMAAAAGLVFEYNPDFIDINMGCPVKKVVRASAGASLMKNPALASAIIAAVVKAVSVPVSVKIRSGWSRHSINAVEIAQIAQDAGAAAITVHGRTVDQGFAGHADWRIISQVKKAVGIPVIGNGDIREPSDALRMFSETGCDAVMVGRGALGNPWLFQGIDRLLRGEDGLPLVGPEQRLEVIKKHYRLEKETYGRPAADRMFRKHLLWYTKGLPGSGKFRQAAGKMSSPEEWFLELERFFRCLDPCLPPEIMA